MLPAELRYVLGMMLTVALLVASAGAFGEPPKLFMAPNGSDEWSVGAEECGIPLDGSWGLSWLDPTGRRGETTPIESDEVSGKLSLKPLTAAVFVAAPATIQSQAR